MTDTARILVKLVQGANELLLTDMAVFHEVRDGLRDEGQTVKLKLHLIENNSGSEHLKLLLHQLSDFNSRAIEASEELVSEPVWLGVKLDDGVGVAETLFGAGWLWKELAGRHSANEQAIEFDYGAGFPFELVALDLVRDLELTFRTKAQVGAQDDAIYGWVERDDLWCGHAQGGIRTDGYGGVILERAATNHIVNSHFGHPTDPDYGWSVSDADLVVTANTDERYVYYGRNSMILANGDALAQQFKQSVNVGSTDPHSQFLLIKKLDGGAPTAADCEVYYNGAKTTVFTADADGFYIAKCENFAGVNGAVNVGIEVKSGKTVVLAVAQLEAGAHCTSYISGDRGRGWSFSATAFESTSVRAAAGLNYRNMPGTAKVALPRDTAAIRVVWQAPYDSDDFEEDGYFLYCSGFRLHYDQANEWFELVGGATIATGTATFLAGDQVFLFAQYGPSGLHLVAYDHDHNVIATAGTGGFTAAAMASAFWLGSASGVNYHCQGTIQDVRIYPRELTEAERVASVDCGRGWAELPFEWSHTGTGAIYDQEDQSTGYYNHVQVENVPGDYDAGCGILLVENTAAVTPLYLYAGVQRRGVPLTAEKATRHLVGNHAKVFIQAEDGLTSFGPDTALATDAGATGGAADNCAAITPSDTLNSERLRIPIANTPDELWKALGTARLLSRWYCANADRFKIRFRVVTGFAVGTYTPQVYLDGDSVWHSAEDDELIVNIPAWFMEPRRLPQAHYGDWAGDPFCSLGLELQADVASGTVKLDGVLLLPQDGEAYGELADTNSWPQNRVVVIDSREGKPHYWIAYDIDRETFHDAIDLWGHLLLPARQPCKLIFCWRRSGVGNPWTKTDSVVVHVKVRPRWAKVR